MACPSSMLVVCADVVAARVRAARPAIAQTPACGRSRRRHAAVIPLQTRLRYTTMIVLPDGEEILDVVCGDKDFWVISATQNIAHVKPAKEGAATNLNLVTASGTVYSFLLTEHGGAATPDLKVYVHAPIRTRRRRSRRYYQRRRGRARSQGELTEARAAIEAAQRRGTKTRSRRIRQQYPTQLQFVYGTPKYEKPFLVRADLARRPVHLHQDGRHGTARALRAEGRQAGAS